MFSFYWNGETDCRFTARNGAKQFRFDRDMTNSAWRHICLTYDYASDTAKFYFDTSTITLEETLTLGSQRSGIGGWYIGGSSTFSGAQVGGSMVLFCMLYFMFFRIPSPCSQEQSTPPKPMH